MTGGGGSLLTSPRPQLVFAAGLVVLLAGVFAGRLDGEFISDDAILVRDNRGLVEPGGLRRILTQDLWSAAGAKPSGVFHPLPMLTFWAEARLWGVAMPPMRLVNVILHAAVAALLFAWLRRRTRSAAAAIFAAWLFAVHPSVTEAVAWLTGRHDLLGAVFGLLAIWVATGAGNRPAVRAGACAGLAALAFFSKEPYAVVPLVALVAGAVLVPRSVVPAGAACAAVVLAFAMRGALGLPAEAERLGAGIGEQIAAAGTVLWHYGAQLLTLSNGPPVASYRSLPLGAATAVLAGAAAICAGLAKLAWSRRHEAWSASARGALVGVVWFGLAAAPHVLSAPFTGLWANRYAYFALAGVVVALAFVLDAALVELGPRPRRLLAVAGAILLAALTLETRAQAGLWRTDLALYGEAARRQPDDGRALYHYAYAVMRRRGCESAAPLFAESARLAPDYARAFRNLAGCLLNLARPADAVAPARRAVALEPEAAEHHYNLGAALLLSGARDEGREELRRALAISPNHTQARALLNRGEKQ